VTIVSVAVCDGRHGVLMVDPAGPISRAIRERPTPVLCGKSNVSPDNRHRIRLTRRPAPTSGQRPHDATTKSLYLQYFSYIIMPARPLHALTPCSHVLRSCLLVALSQCALLYASYLHKHINNRIHCPHLPTASGSSSDWLAREMPDDPLTTVRSIQSRPAVGRSRIHLARLLRGYVTRISQRQPIRNLHMRVAVMTRRRQDPWQSNKAILPLSTVTKARQPKYPPVVRVNPVASPTGVC